MPMSVAAIRRASLEGLESLSIRVADWAHGQLYGGEPVVRYVDDAETRELAAGARQRALKDGVSDDSEWGAARLRELRQRANTR